jgi:unsaturated chondroitin disaccharide hydrolase
MLNHLPEDLIPYWDYDFTEGDEPRDASAGAIAVCGMHEMLRHLPADAEQRAVFESAGPQILEAIIDKCTGDIGEEYDGLIHHVTHAKPQGQGINEMAVYADYFYLEALLRYLKPDWNKYW